MDRVRAITIPADPNKPLVHRTIKQSDLATYRYWTGGEAVKAVLLNRPPGVLYVPVKSKAFNPRATSLARKHRDTPANEVFGDALLLGSISSDGRDMDVLEEYVTDLQPEAERYRVEIRFPDSPEWSLNGITYDDYDEAMRVSAYMANQYDKWRIVPTDHPKQQPYQTGSEQGTGPHRLGLWETSIDVILLPADISKRPRLRTFQRELAEYQKAVGGPIEAVNIYGPDATVYLNESGHDLQLPVNYRAEALIERHRPGFCMHNVILGDVIILGPPDEDGNDTTVAREYLRELGLIRG